MEYTQVLFSILDLFVNYPPQRLGVVAPKWVDFKNSVSLSWKQFLQSILLMTFQVRVECETVWAADS